MSKDVYETLSKLPQDHAFTFPGIAGIIEYKITSEGVQTVPRFVNGYIEVVRFSECYVINAGNRLKGNCDVWHLPPNSAWAQQNCGAVSTELPGEVTRSPMAFHRGLVVLREGNKEFTQNEISAIVKRNYLFDRLAYTGISGLRLPAIEGYTVQ